MELTSSASEGQRKENPELEHGEEIDVEKNTASKRKCYRWGSEFTSTPEQEFWIGGFPSKYSNIKKARKILWENTRKGIEAGFVKIFIRKGFRSINQSTGKKEWQGYAIVAYSSQDAAIAAIGHFDGYDVINGEGSSFTLRAKKALPPKPKMRNNRRKLAAVNKTFCVQNICGKDPNIEEQIKPLLPNEIEERYRRLVLQSRADPNIDLSDDKRSSDTRQLLIRWYKQNPRRERFISTGTFIPDALYEKVCDYLCSMQWPPKRHRKKVVADNYLVLWRDKHVETYSELRHLAAEVIALKDPEYKYSHLAITKNFVGSPHIDRLDRSYQYAISFGNFEGGELCIESEKCGNEIFVINTKQRLVKLDGRYVHWVRGFRGDRFSIIYFNTDEEYSTAKTFAIYEKEDDTIQPS